MAEKDGITYRRAEEEDLYPLLKLYQTAIATVPFDPVLLDARLLRDSLRSPTSVWIVAEKDHDFVATLSINVDRDNRLARIHRFVSDPTWRDSEGILTQALPLLIGYLKEKGVDVLYCTTRTLTFAQQELTMKMGFRMLGIFPDARGADPTRLSGLTAYFFDEVLGANRFSQFELHPVLAPFYEIARRQCDLPPLPVLDRVARPEEGFEPLPTLEIIHAPHFVAHRFEKLKQKKSLSVHFYPFHEPNALVTDPGQRIEVFVRILPVLRFAAIIGERLDMAVNPSELYCQFSLMLNERNVSYIEIINDAADPWGTECILNAGYVPCGYFPAFKRHGEVRRDYVVYAQSFEKLFSTATSRLHVNRVYLDFLTQYYRLEASNYLDKIDTE